MHRSLIRHTKSLSLVRICKWYIFAKEREFFFLNSVATVSCLCTCQEHHLNSFTHQARLIWNLSWIGIDSLYRMNSVCSCLPRKSQHNR